MSAQWFGHGSCPEHWRNVRELFAVNTTEPIAQAWSRFAIRHRHIRCVPGSAMSFIQGSIERLIFAIMWWSCCQTACAMRVSSLADPNTSRSMENKRHSSVLECARSWSSYSSFIDANTIWVTITTTYHHTKLRTLAYGTGDVYTSTLGIPVASEGFTPTMTELATVVVTGITANETMETMDAALTREPPTCSSLYCTDCSLLYASYMHSLGLPQTATVPSITPPPSNSPACPVCHFQPSVSCSWSTEVDPGCTVTASDVQLFYFESDTIKYRDGVAETMIHEYAPGVTFTCPSVYLLFESLTAAVTHYGVDRNSWYCGPAGCSGIAMLGGAVWSTVGTNIDSTLICRSNGSSGKSVFVLN